MRILLTGSQGLIGRVVEELATPVGHAIDGFDRESHRPPGFGGILDPVALTSAVSEADGIIHLAAIARVKHAEVDPVLCHRVNVQGSRNIFAAAANAPRRPWVLVASSREVYGIPSRLPVKEDDPVNPHNTYGSSKVMCEEAALEARRQGLRVAILRLANVYGRVEDHPDRVVPAFCRAAVRGTPIRIEGSGYMFDFTHVNDVALGILRLSEMLNNGMDNAPPIHLASGTATSLESLAHMVNAAAGRNSPIEHVANHAYNVPCFVGDPSRAQELLRWGATTPLEDGIQRLVNDFLQSH